LIFLDSLAILSFFDFSTFLTLLFLTAFNLSRIPLDLAFETEECFSAFSFLDFGAAFSTFLIAAS